MTKIKNDPDKYSVIKERISQWGSQGKNTEVVSHSLLQGTTFGQISNLKRWCCESATLNMLENLENSTVATGLEKVSFQSNPPKKQCQGMLKLLHNYTRCTH